MFDKALILLEGTFYTMLSVDLSWLYPVLTFGLTVLVLFWPVVLMLIGDKLTKKPTPPFVYTSVTIFQVFWIISATVFMWNYMTGGTSVQL